jgi:hypothetical protein
VLPTSNPIGNAPVKVTRAPAVVGKPDPDIFADEFVNVTDLVNGAKFVGSVPVVVNEQGVPPVIGNVALLLLIFDDPFTKVTGAVTPVPYAAPAAAGPAVIV